MTNIIEVKNVSKSFGGVNANIDITLNVKKGSTKGIEDTLVEIFGTKVKLKPSQVGGSIEIVYFSDDDLERILDLLQSI